MITADFFAGNRQRLCKELPAGSVVVLTAYTQAQRGHDFAHTFEQEANFWYLTGIDASDWLLILDTDTGEEMLISPDINSTIETFDGSLGAGAAIERSGIKNVRPRKELKRILEKLIAGKKRTYTVVPQRTDRYGFSPNPAHAKLRSRLKGAKEIVDIRPILGTLRAIKQPIEVAAMQAAIDMTIDAFKVVFSEVHQYEHEYEASARATYEFMKRGANHAYDPIVATGVNACTLHHLGDATKMKSQDWVLFDIGARVHGYPADITRTIPLGPPTQRQIAIYEAVRRVHDFAVHMLRDGQNVREYLQQTDAKIGEELIKLGLIKKSTFKTVHKYMPHAISHGLGVDVHDPLGRPETFKAGMVLTVEPGIYIPEENIGIRLENDIHITADGPKNLSEHLPSELTFLQKMIY